MDIFMTEQSMKKWSDTYSEDQVASVLTNILCLSIKAGLSPDKIRSKVEGILAKLWEEYETEQELIWNRIILVDRFFKTESLYEKAHKACCGVVAHEDATVDNVGDHKVVLVVSSDPEIIQKAQAKQIPSVYIGTYKFQDRKYIAPMKDTVEFWARVDELLNAAIKVANKKEGVQ